MDPEPRIMQGFIDHTVRWALALPVEVRLVARRDDDRAPHRDRQARRGEPRGDHFGDPKVWDEIAGRIEDEGHMPTDA
jgi:hypothetical protein